MRKLIYSMGVSLDGFIAGPGGEIDWTAPDEELHRFHNEQVREIGVAPLRAAAVRGRCVYWETARRDPAAAEHELEFAAHLAGACRRSCSRRRSRRSRATPGSSRGDAAEEVARLKEQPGKDLAVGGAGLAASLIGSGLVDEYRLFVSPVVLGARHAVLPGAGRRIDLELVETRTFGSRVVYLRYVRAGGSAIVRHASGSGPVPRLILSYAAGASASGTAPKAGRTPVRAEHARAILVVAEVPEAEGPECPTSSGARSRPTG